MMGSTQTTSMEYPPHWDSCSPKLQEVLGSIGLMLMQEGGTETDRKRDGDLARREVLATCMVFHFGLSGLQTDMK